MQTVNSQKNLIMLAAFVVVVGGMKIAAPLLVPLLLALFLAILIASPYSWLQTRGLPAWLALVCVLLVFFTMVFLVGSLIGSSAQDLSRQFPVYQERLQDMTTGMFDWLADKGLNFSITSISEYLDPGKVMSVSANILGGMQNLLTNSFLIILTTIFILVEIPNIPDKWRAGKAKPEQSLEHFKTAAANVNHYMGIKTITSLLTGIFIAFILWLIGVDYPLLWGVIAFLLNFIPNIGSIIAAVPVILLALVQLGVGASLATAGGYIAVNVLIGNVIEPKIMGKGLGLSTLVVFISLIFWGWVLGPVGMLLSVPLTIAVKIALESNQQTRWIAVLLGPKIEATNNSKTA